MSPLKKRAKIAIAATRSAATLELTCETVDGAFDAILAKDCPKSENNQDAWIAVATLHKRMLQKIRQQEEELKAIREKRLKREQEELATQYERDHLQSQIEEYRTYPLTNLEQLAREECRKQEASSSNNDTDDNSATSNREEILRKFLQVDINDPNQKDAVTLKLQKCFEHRAELGKKVQVKRQALKKIQQELKTQLDFLSSLPMHIQTLERASQSLVKFMQKHALMHPLSGNERLQRLRRAKSLPPPMYTLFALLQHAIDEHPGVNIKISPNDQVVLQFPFPDVATAANAKKPVARHNLSITLMYEGGQVKAEASGCSSLINQEMLLQELFEGDCSTSGSYCWANQLAGLHPVAVASVASTGLVLRELQRRIHAHAVLHYCLLELESGKLPTPPGADVGVAFVKTARFTKTATTTALDNTNADHDDDAFYSEYDVSIENVVVDVKVQIARRRYPAKPPIWSIPMEKTLEQRLNVDLLQEVSEETGPWILIHQVRALLGSAGSEKVAAFRVRRGRSRKIT